MKGKLTHIGDVEINCPFCFSEPNKILFKDLACEDCMREADNIMLKVTTKYKSSYFAEDPQ